MTRYCLTLDLKSDLNLINEYIDCHKHVWPEIRESILVAGIHNMEIYCYQNRLFMIMEVDDNFSFEKKNQLDLANPKVQEWEKLMWKYQQQLPTADPDKKWVLMDRIYSTKEVALSSTNNL